MIRWLKSWRTALLVALVSLVVVLFCGPLEYGVTYLHFSTLNKQRLVEEADTYIHDRVPGSQLACLYAVQCMSGRASLELVKDIEAWDIGATKRSIWKRRTSGQCPGSTANFGIHVIPHEEGEPISRSTSHAVWSFFNDRFIPVQTRFGGSAFSEQPWEPCTANFAIAGK